MSHRNPGKSLRARIPPPREMGPGFRFHKSSKRRRQSISPSRAKAVLRHRRRLELLRFRTVATWRLLIACHGIDEALRLMGRKSRRGVYARMVILESMAGE